MKKAATLLVLVVAVSGLIGWIAYRSGRAACLSYEPALRGEIMRRADGALLYFNGQCWTHQFVAPTDTPF